jgi:hypothetical protein
LVPPAAVSGRIHAWEEVPEEGVQEEGGMSQPDPALLQAIRQADAAWALVWEARRAFYLSVAAVVATLLLAFVAVAVPAWLRCAAKRDAKETERRAWSRFTEAFEAVADAHNAVVAASQSEHPATAFESAESQLQRATEALTRASATELPVAVVLNVVAAQQKSAAILALFPDLKLYGGNLLNYKEVVEKINQTRDDVLALLTTTQGMAPS